MFETQSTGGNRPAAPVRDGEGLAPRSAATHDLLSHLKPGDHACLIYDPAEDWRRPLLPFFAQGLERGEQCLYVADGHEPLELLAALRQVGLPVEASLASRQLLLLQADDVFSQGGAFDPERAVAALVARMERAFSEGYSGLRVTGEMSWALRTRHGRRRLLAYETGIGAGLLARYPCTVLCQYDRRLFHPRLLKSIVTIHPLLVMGSSLYENTHYVPADGFPNGSGGQRELEYLLGSIVREQESKEHLRHSELRYRIVANNTYDWEVWVGPDSRFLFSSASCERITGYAPAEFENDSSLLARLVHPEDRARFEAHRKNRLQPEPGVVEFRIVARDGAVRWIEHVCQPVFDERGTYLGRRGSNRDATERKAAEEALRQSEQRSGALTEAAFEGIVIHEDGIVLDANHAFAEMLGYELNELVGTSLYRLMPPGECERARRRVAAGDEAACEVTGITKHGRRFIADVRVRGSSFNGRPVRIAGVRDVTERRRIEAERERLLAEAECARQRSDELAAALQPERDLLETIMENTRTHLAYLDREFRFVCANSSYVAGCGHSRDDLIGRNHFDLFPNSENEAIFRRVRDSGQSVEFLGRAFEYADQPERGVTYWDWTLVPVKDSRGLVQGLVLSLQDVTQTVRDQLHIESQAEEVAMQKSELEHLMLDLQRERERLAVTLNSIGDGVIATDATGNVVLINRVAEALSGWSETEAIGKPLTDVFRTENERTGEPGPELVRSVLERGQVMGLASHTALLSRQGDSRPITDSAAPILDGAGSIVGVVLAFQDVSEQRKLEEETSRANKLEALGLLAGGIGHDFNNLLTAIMGNIVLARLEAEASSELAEVLGEAERAATRARGLTQQLLTFAKGGAPVRQAVPLAELLAESAKFALRGSRLRGEFDLPSDVWPVDVDEGQISQVIQNLAINADEASPDGGTLRLSLRNVVVAADEVPPLAPGRYVLLSVADHGTGIPPQYMDKVFDPYFTTKQKGSGLGLATTYAIVKRHDGHITVASQLGAGTTFNVYLPAAHGLLASSGEEVGAGGVAGGGRILLMDDEEVVRRVARKMLGHLGYQVDLAPDGSEAIAMYQQAKEEGRPYAAVVMDLTVPAGMGGREAVARLRLLDPEVRAIVSSGFSNDPVMAEFRDHGFSGVIGKPYRLEELSSALRRAIGGGSVQSRATSDT